MPRAASSYKFFFLLSFHLASVVKTRRKTAPLGFPPVASRPPRASSVRREFGVCIIVVRNSAVCSISHLVGVGVGHTAAAAVQDGALFGSLFFLGGGTVNETHELEESSGGEKKR